MKTFDIIMLILEAFMLICGVHLIAAILNVKTYEVIVGIVCYLWAYVMRSNK